MGQAKRKKALQVAVPLKLDFGCGPRKRPGFTGIDQIKFDGVDLVLDVRKTPWPWKDKSVDEVFTSHFVEHLAGAERVVFFNELYRVMKSGAQVSIIVPDWSNDRAYGDPTHQWPPMSRWSFLYLNKDWRTQNAPHCGYTCHFEGPIGGNVEPWVAVRNEEMKIFASQHYVNALSDLITTLTRK
jgi:hypothetical protein